MKYKARKRIHVSTMQNFGARPTQREGTHFKTFINEFDHFAQKDGLINLGNVIQTAISNMMSTCYKFPNCSKIHTSGFGFILQS